MRTFRSLTRKIGVQARAPSGYEVGVADVRVVHLDLPAHGSSSALARRLVEASLLDDVSEPVRAAAGWQAGEVIGEVLRAGSIECALDVVWSTEGAVRVEVEAAGLSTCAPTRARVQPSEACGSTGTIGWCGGVEPLPGFGTRLWFEFRGSASGHVQLSFEAPTSLPCPLSHSSMRSGLEEASARA